ncbi:cellulase family glycosylhydrolase [Sphingomonas sp. T1]|uniref:cellulase family glycosylhydrolase n=1 Tax=Sphingomonas sp. T1 TaxID=2653172 RepID=UPI001357FDC0|nr:cellulase family glycosylhydrolase [Sphingomonas sp. T1]
MKRQMGRELLADGTRAAGWPAWNDRSRSNAAGNGFEMIGATKLRFVGNVQGKGWVYAPADARPCAAPAGPAAVVAPAAPAAPGAPAQPANHTARAGPLFGANLSGAEASGGDAIRPSLEDWKGYIERHGFKLIRYPFKDDRMTPARIAELKVSVAYARSKGVPVILDNHTYRWDSVERFIQFWTAFARNFPDDGSVIIDPVNEPRGFNDSVLTNDWDQWLRDSNLIIAGLRANGIRHPILLEYPHWSATFRFDKKEGPKKACESAGCAIDRGGGLKDPLGLTFINGHRYFDKGSSGTNKECATSVSGFAEFAQQLRQRGLKGYITESAFASHYGMKASCVAVGAEAIAALRANSDVLLGITWWGGGRVWPESYIFKIDPPKAARFSASTSSYVERLTGR